MAILAIPVGIMVDRFAPRRVMAAGAAFLGVGALALSAAPTTTAAMTLLAAGQSLIGGGSATLARFFGRREHGAIRASVSRIGVIGTGLEALLTAGSFAVFASYRPALWLCAALTAPLVVMLWRLQRPTPPAGEPT